MQSYKMKIYLFFFIIWSTSTYDLVLATEFTFDLADRAEECFYEMIDINTNCTLEFHVVSGGKLDVDVYIEKPSRTMMYHELRKEYDLLEFNAPESGEYMICFDNKFSTITTKSIYFALNVGIKEPLFERQEDSHSIYIEDSADIIHDHLFDIINGQTQYRLQEAYGRKYAKILNDRVMWWSLAQTLLILTIGVSQVVILRRFFSDPKPSKATSMYTNFCR